MKTWDDIFKDFREDKVVDARASYALSVLEDYLKENYNNPTPKDKVYPIFDESGGIPAVFPEKYCHCHDKDGICGRYCKRCCGFIK